MEPKVIKIASGTIVEYGENESKFFSAYKKSNTYQFAFVFENGLECDQQADKKHHGGIDKAILIASNQHIKRFEDEYQTTLDNDAFGENILIDNLDEKDIHVGDIYKIGDCKIQITQPRQPCWKIGAIFGKNVSRYITKHHATGWYAKVLQEGEIRKSDLFELISRESPYSIYELSEFLKTKPSQDILDEIYSYPFVAQSYKNDLQK